MRRGSFDMCLLFEVFGELLPLAHTYDGPSSSVAALLEVMERFKCVVMSRYSKLGVVFTSSKKVRVWEWLIAFATYHRSLYIVFLFYTVRRGSLMLPYRKESLLFLYVAWEYA